MRCTRSRSCVSHLSTLDCKRYAIPKRRATQSTLQHFTCIESRHLSASCACLPSSRFFFNRPFSPCRTLQSSRWTNIFSRACSGMDRDKMAVVQEFHWSDRNFFHRLLLLRRVAFLVSSTAGDVNTNFFYDDPKRRRPGTWNRYSSSPEVGNLRLVVYASQFDNPSNTTKKK